MLVEKSFDTGEVVLNYAEGPDNGPPILLIHGALGRWQDYTPYLPKFTEKNHVYAMDSRGRGKSGRTPDKYKVRDMIPDVTTFIDTLIGKPTTLIGHSEGGWISLWAAHRSPENVSAIVLLDSPITLDAFIQEATGGPMREAMQEIRESLGHPVEELEKILKDQDPSRSSEAIRYSAECRSLADPEYLDHWAQGRLKEYFEGFEPWEFFRSLSCPVLLVQADPKTGGSLSSEDVEKAQAISPRIHHTLVEGVGHNLGTNSGEDPIDVGPILRFLESLR
jgi:pimeloyl-ACP methyl ester carboxylesterase